MNNGWVCSDARCVFEERGCRYPSLVMDQVGFEDLELNTKLQWALFGEAERGLGRVEATFWPREDRVSFDWKMKVTFYKSFVMSSRTQSRRSAQTWHLVYSFDLVCTYRNIPRWLQHPTFPYTYSILMYTSFYIPSMLIKLLLTMGTNYTFFNNTKKNEKPRERSPTQLYKIRM